MRPYFAIVKDSFREALASRVLWVLLLLITVLLIGLLPFHWQSSIAAEMTAQDIRNVRNLAASLKSGQRRDAGALKKHLWESLSEGTRKRIDQLTGGQGPPGFVVREELAQDFNRIIKRDDFYREKLWSSARLSDRAKELLDQSKLDGESQAQLNRLALEAALPGQLRPCPDEAVSFRYAAWDMDFVPPISRKIATEAIDTFVLVFMAFLVGIVGIFVAILVTAPIIPNMLDSGSLHVLLSKPISRPLLFLAKFFGGCSFVLISAGYLIVGVWLILGFRFGIWKPQILWSIPIFLFSFAIFYSVSALSGLIWRSTVMAIVATILFWVFCKAVGSTKDLLEQLVIVPQKITNVVEQEGQLFVFRRNGKVARWNPDSSTMDVVFEDKSNEQMGGPVMMMGRRQSLRGMVYDAANEQIIALDRKWGSQGDVVIGKKSEGWIRQVTSAAPPNAAALLWHQSAPIAVADRGVYRISSETLDSQRLEINIFGLKIPGPPPKELHENVSAGITEPLPGDARVAFDPSASDIFVHGGRALRKWRQGDDGLFREEERVDIDLDEVNGISAGGGLVVLATMDETVRLHPFEAATLQPQRQHETGSEIALRKLAVSSDGRWIAVLFDNDRLELVDRQADRSVTRLPSQDAIADVAFTATGLRVVDANDRVLTLSLPELTTDAVLVPRSPLINTLYRYLVKPLYLIFPKPAELQNTMQYAITGRETVEIESPGMSSTTIKLNPWQPLISNSAFIGVMLLIGCLYVYRQDF